METKKTGITYRKETDSENAPWQQLSNIDELIWDGIYLLNVVNDNGSHNMPLRITDTDTVTLVVKDHALGEARTVVQTITRVERSSGKEFIYTRTRCNTCGEYIWSEWTETHKNIELGEVDSFDIYTESGNYSGVYTNGNVCENFSMVVIDNKAVASAKGEVRSVSQFKYSLNLDGTFSFKTRIGHGNESVTWNSWVDIGAADTTDIQDNSITAQKLSIDVRKKVTDVTEIKNKALQTDTVQIIADVDKINIGGRSIDRTNTMSVDLPAASTEKAGVMSAEDKGKLDSIKSEVFLLNNSKNTQSGFYDRNMVYFPSSGFTCAKINVSELVSVEIRAYVHGNAAISLVDKNDNLLYQITDNYSAKAFEIDLLKYNGAFWLYVSNSDSYNQEFYVLAKSLGQSVISEIIKTNTNVEDINHKIIDIKNQGLWYKSKQELKEDSISNKYIASNNEFSEATGLGSYLYDISGITNTILLTSGISENQYVKNFALVKNEQIIYVGNLSSLGSEEVIPSSLLCELQADTLYVTYKDEAVPCVMVVSLYSDSEAEVLNERIQSIDNFTGDKVTLISNTMIANNGVFNSEGFCSTEKIPVSYGSRIYIHTYLFGNAVVAFFNDEDKILSWYRNEDYTSLALFEKELNVPTGATYFRASCSTAKIVFFKFRTIDITSAVSRVSRQFQPIESSIESFVENGFITSAGVVASTTGYNCTGYVPIGIYKGSIVKINCTIYGNASLVFFDKNKNVIGYINGGNASDYGISAGQDIRTITVTIPQHAEYLRASLISPSNASNFKIVGLIDTLTTTIKDIFGKVTEITPLVARTLLGKRILVIGDSISTDYYGGYKKWVTNLIDEGVFPVDVNNNSIHATGFVANYGTNEDNDFITRIEAVEAPETYDMVIVFGGINDFIQNIPLGEINDDKKTHFKPAVDYFFDYLVNNFTRARIAVLLPLRTYHIGYNEQGIKQQEYIQYIHNVAKSYCLPVLNLTEESGYCPFVDEFKNMWTLVPEGYTVADGVHPNAEYYVKYLTPMIKSFILRL